MNTPSLSRFIETTVDAERLALGEATLAAAWREAGEAGLTGWQETIYEYLAAVREGRPLDRPL